MMSHIENDDEAEDLALEFHKALTDDNHEKVAELLFMGADVNHSFKSGIFFKHPAHICCEKGNILSLEVLIRCEADLECIDQWGQRPLHHGVKKRQHKILKLLLENKVEVNARDGYGRSPLFYAIELGDRLMLEMLLDYGATVNFQDKYGQSPLHVAASRSIFDWLLQRMLQEADVKLDLFDRRKRTPLQHAVLNGSVNGVMALLVAHADTDVVDYQGMTPLLNAVTAFSRSAVEEAHLEKTEWLVKFGADVNKANPKTGRTPLHVLVGTRQNCDHLAQLLIKFGADINQKDSNGCTPLLLALHAGNKQAARLLIKENCDTSPIGTVTIVDNVTHVNALDICITQGFVDMLQILLEDGASLDCAKYFERLFGDPMFMTNLPPMLSLLNSHLTNVPPLMRFCRTSIRCSLGPHPSALVDKLGLPKYLMRYVLLEAELLERKD